VSEDDNLKYLIDQADGILNGTITSHEDIRRTVYMLKRYLTDHKDTRRTLELMEKWCDFVLTVARLRQQGVRAPVRRAEEEVARRWGHNSGKALRKSLQPSRMRAAKNKDKTTPKMSL
jgi:hypothetical protein